MSILQKEYNLANFKKEAIPTFYSEIKVSIIDIYSSNEVEVLVNDYLECACNNSVNSSIYFKECSKCHGSGKLFINKHELTCNECKGKGKVRVKDCYLCNNKDKIVLKNKIKVKLDPSLLNTKEIVINKSDCILVLKLDVYDIDDYYFDNDNIYYLKTIYYSKKDKTDKRKVAINTIKGIEYVESEFKINKEIVCLANKGLNNKDFYFTFENEIDKKKIEIYTNVILKDNGYALIKDLVDNEYVFLTKTLALDSPESVYIDSSIGKVETYDYIIYLNKLDSDLFINKDNKAYLKVYLTKEDKDMDKKIININNENINLTFKKNSKEIQELQIYSKCIKDKQGKRDKLNVLIYPYFDNIYKVSVYDNKNSNFIEDYKLYNYELVDSFKTSKYLTNPINIENKTEIVLNNDLIKIRRVSK